MGFGEAIATCFAKYGTFDGRGSRSEFWWFFLFGQIAWACMALFYVLIGYLMGGFLSASINYFVALIVYSLAFIIPSLSASSRRLHDTNRSAWWIILYFTGIGIIPLIMWWAQAGDAGPNQYGPPTTGAQQPGDSAAAAPAAAPQAVAAAQTAPAPARAKARSAAAPAAVAQAAASTPPAPEPAAHPSPPYQQAPQAAPQGNSPVLIVALIIAILLLAAAGIYFATHGKGSGTPPADTSAESTASAAPAPAHPAAKRKPVRHERIEAGDVSIDEDSNGHSRVRAGDIELKD